MRPRRRLALASELATVVLMRPLFAASASMKKFTVDPVPTPTTMSSSTKARAASAAAFFCAFWSMGREDNRSLAMLRPYGEASEGRRLPRTDPHGQGVRRGDGEPARGGARAVAAH